MYKEIQDEHRELADRLKAELVTLENAPKRERYEATKKAVFELALAMDGKYHRDAWDDIVGEFDDMLREADCGEVSSTLYWASVDEETGEELDSEPVDKWESADYADVSFYEANWTHSDCTEFETFASYVMKLILGCFGKADGPIPFFGDISTEVDGANQFFRVEKGY